jgi:hypothetical protein
MIEITHNFDPARFVWLWSKYVTGLIDRPCRLSKALSQMMIRSVPGQERRIGPGAAALG